VLVHETWHARTLVAQVVAGGGGFFDTGLQLPPDAVGATVSWT
jgi:hypothetical protein